MCNGEVGRASVGGTIAILKPTTTAGGPALPRELSLRLIDDQDTGATAAAIDGLDFGGRGNQIVIQ